MDALLSFASFAALLALFGVVAAIVGEDSRDDFGHGHDHGLGASALFR